MLAHLAHLLHLPPLVAYIIVLSALLIGAVSLGWILHRVFHRVALHVKVNASSDSEEVEITLQEAARKVAGQFNLPASQEPQVTMTLDFTDPVLQFAVNVPVPQLSDGARVSAALRKEIAKRYRAGVLKFP